MTKRLPALVNGRNLWVLPLVLAVLTGLAPWLGVGPADLRQIILITVLAIAVSGLNLAWGYGGELAVGQIVMYCIGAYVTGFVATRGYDMALGVVLSVLAAALVGLITGLPALRVSGWGIAMASFFLVLLIPPTLEAFKGQTGGLTGLLGIPGPTLFGVELSDRDFYVVVIVCAAVWLLLMRNMVTSRHGAALRVVRESPVLANALGLSVPRMKLTTYALGAAPAGLAGSLFVYVDRFLAPGYFDFSAATLIIAASVLGGLETVYGAIVGAAILTIGSNQISSFDSYAEIVYGFFLIAGGVLLTNPKVRTAFADFRRRARSWRVPSDPPMRGVPEIAAIHGAELAVAGVAKSFGGSVALRGVDIEAQPGRITALIGANGSGKTTLLNIISGFYRNDEGTVTLDGRPLSLGRPAKTARQGIARTFQTPIVPQSVTTLDAVAVARYTNDRAAILPAMLRLPGYRRVARRDREEALSWLTTVGLRDVAGVLASSLPLGNRRLLEVARALATGSAVLLLDEPASGLGEDDVKTLGALLRRLRDAGATIVLVEHNFGMVCDIADSIYVLERGEVLAHGDAAMIRTDPAVARSYLGQEFGATTAQLEVAQVAQVAP